MWAVILLFGLIGVGAPWSGAVAKEQKIGRKELPAAIRKAIDSRYPGAEFIGLSREADRGGVIYEVEMKVAGKRVDALFEPTGHQREEEALIAVATLPAPVRAAFARSAHAKGTIERAERVTRAPMTSAPKYELLVSEGKRRFEFVYAADGTLESGKKADAND